MRELLEKIFLLNSIAIIGMEKNVGKTTTMNYLIKNARDQHSLGLTSIGIDGEMEDQVTGTEKPRIYLQKGTIIASAKKSYLESDVTKEILSTTGIQTPMGEVILFKALSDGYIELMGPSINKYLKAVIEQLKAFGCNLVIIDGALNRSTTASPAIAEGVIMATGASLSRNINDAVRATVHKLNLLQIDWERDSNKRKIILQGLSRGKISFVFGDRLEISKELSAIGGESAIKEGMEAGADGVIVNGVVGDRLVQHLISQRLPLRGKTIYVEDGTKLFIKEENYQKLILKGMKIIGLNPINIIMITANPKSPEGYHFDSKQFCNFLYEKTKLPVYDVISNIGVGIVNGE